MTEFGKPHRSNIDLVQRPQWAACGRVGEPDPDSTPGPKQSLGAYAAKDWFEPIVLKNYSLIVAQAADSICVLDRGICDVGTKAGGAGSTVL